MFGKLKKMLYIIPLMVLGLFMFGGVEVSAADAKMVGVEKFTIGTNADNTYYIATSNTWEFQADYSFWGDLDGFVRWRVVRPDGRATDWSDYIEYVKYDGKFTIGDYTRLSYTQTVASRTSIAPASTYFVDLEYYGSFFMKWHQEDKDETIKIIASGEDVSYSTPVIEISFNESTNKVSISASVEKDGEGYGIITEVKYLFSETAIEISDDAQFTAALTISNQKGALSFVPSSVVSKNITAPNDKYTYIYVMAKTAHGHYSVMEFELVEGSGSNNDQTTPGNPGDGSDSSEGDPKDNDEADSGLFDFDFGELILIVLVIVLVVSCALIITQKIVDYKKRLY